MEELVETSDRELDEEALDMWSSIMLLILGSREGRLSRRGSLGGRGLSGVSGVMFSTSGENFLGGEREHGVDGLDSIGLGRVSSG